jgi:hypothetical protein
VGTADVGGELALPKVNRTNSPHRRTLSRWRHGGGRRPGGRDGGHGDERDETSDKSDSAHRLRKAEPAGVGKKRPTRFTRSVAPTFDRTVTGGDVLRATLPSVPVAGGGPAGRAGLSHQDFRQVAQHL